MLKNVCKKVTYNSNSWISHWEQDLMSVWMEWKVHIKLCWVILEISFNCNSFILRERMRPRISVTARSSWSSQVSWFIRDQPIVLKVTIWINSVASCRDWSSGLAPVSVGAASIFITIRIRHRNDVPVDVLSNVLDFRIIWAKQLVKNKGWSGRGNPFSSVNIRFNENCSIVLE